MPKHTPGPWRVLEQPGDPDEYILVGNVDRWIVAFRQNGELPISEQLANAGLISALPDLLAACQEFVRKVECGEASSRRSYKQMKAAIAKAEGES